MDVTNYSHISTSQLYPDKETKLEKCAKVLKIADLKRRIESLVQKNQKTLTKSGLGHISAGALSKASQMKIDAIREEYEREKGDLGRELAEKNLEI